MKEQLLKYTAKTRIGARSALVLAVSIWICSPALAAAQNAGQRIGDAWIAIDMSVAEVERLLGQSHTLSLAEGRVDGPALYSIVETSSGGETIGTIHSNDGRVLQITTMWTPVDQSALALAETITSVIGRVVVPSGEPPVWRTARDCDIGVLNGVRSGNAPFIENALRCGRHTIRIILAAPPDQERYVLIEHETR